MIKNASERSGRSERLPRAPAPVAASARDGAEQAREEVRRYLPNLVRALLGIALSPDADVSLHSRTLAIRQCVEIAGVIASPTPMPPPPEIYEGTNGGREAD